MKTTDGSPKSIFAYEDYKVYLTDLLEQGPSRGQRAALANAINCQATYLSRVLNAEADLSLEQAELTCRHFILEPAETEYFIALVGEARSGSESLKIYWRKQRAKAKKGRLELKGRTDLPATLSEQDQIIYYSDWLYSAVHTALTIPSTNSAQRIADFLRVDVSKIKNCLEFLCSVGLAKKSGQFFAPGETRLHLDKHSPLVRKHHLNWKFKTIQRIEEPDEEDLHYSSVASLSKEDYDKIREIFLSAISSGRKVIKDSPAEMLFCYSVSICNLGPKS